MIVHENSLPAAAYGIPTTTEVAEDSQTNQPSQACEEMVAYRISALGDVALTSGTLLYWHIRHELRFHMVTRAALATLFYNHPAVISVIGLENDDLHGLDELKTFKNLAAQFSNLKLVDLHCSIRSRLLRLLWKNKTFAYRKMSLERRIFLKSKGRFCGDKLQQINVPQRFSTALTKYLGGEIPPPNDVRPAFFLTLNDFSALPKFTAKLDQGYIALHPFAGSIHKTWPPDYWAQLAALLNDAAIPYVWIGQGADLPENMPTGQGNLVNRLDLRQTLAVLSKAALLVSGDSGPVLLARGVNTPVLSLEGPTSPGRDFYLKSEQDQVLVNQINCRPCSLHGKVKSCKHGHACMRGINPQAVFSAIYKMIKP